MYIYINEYLHKYVNAYFKDSAIWTRLEYIVLIWAYFHLSMYEKSAN